MQGNAGGGISFALARSASRPAAVPPAAAAPGRPAVDYVKSVGGGVLESLAPPAAPSSLPTIPALKNTFEVGHGRAAKHKALSFVPEGDSAAVASSGDRFEKADADAVDTSLIYGLNKRHKPDGGAALPACVRAFLL